MLAGRFPAFVVPPRWEKLLKKLLLGYPLTLAGSLLFILCLYLLGSSFASKNPYDFLLSAVGLVVLAVLVLLGTLQGRRFAKIPAVWDSSAPLYARLKGVTHCLVMENLRTLPFFRLHFCLRGSIAVGRGAACRVWQDTSGRDGRQNIPVFFTLSGIYHAKAHLKIKDIFGLTQARFGEVWERQLVVRPALMPDREFTNIEAIDGLENKSKIKQSDIERYFMREYIPGDRVRDINWKASSRLSELVTRIAPVTQEKTQVLTVVLRNYRKGKRETVESIGHLNYVKSWLLLFLKVLKKRRPEFQFRVISSDGVRILESEEDIGYFAEELSGVFFRAPEPGMGIGALPGQAGIMAPVSRAAVATAAVATAAVATAAGSTGASAAATSPASADSGLSGSGTPGPGDLFVFTTPFDATLNADLALMSSERVHLFRTTWPRSREREGTGKTVSLLPEWHHLLYPSVWFLLREKNTKRPTSVHPAAGRTEEEALDVRLV